MSEQKALPLEKKVVLDALGAIVAEKRDRVMALGMQNVYGLSEVERMRASMAYTQARTELANAEADLAAAIRRGSV